MDGPHQNIVLQFFLGLFAAVAALGQTPPAQERVRLGLLPAIVTTQPAPPRSLALAPPDSLFEPHAAALHRHLLAALAAEKSITLVCGDSLHLRPALDPFNADSVRLFCQNLQLAKLLLPTLEFSSSPSAEAARARVMLRWLDAVSGEMTKFHVIEFESSRRDTSLSGFEARAAAQTLLEAPELILTQEQQIALLPALRDLPPPAEVRRKSRRWLWYVSAAALLSGSSAYLLLHEPQEAHTKRFLPEPPGPPPQ